MIFQRIRKNQPFLKFQVFGVLQSSRSVFYHLHLNLMRTALKTLFLKKGDFCMFSNTTSTLDREAAIPKHRKASSIKCTHSGKNHFLKFICVWSKKNELELKVTN